MKVLFFSNIPIAQSVKGGYNGGGWISSLIEILSRRDDLEIGVGFLGSHDSITKKGNITLFQICVGKGNKKIEKIKKAFKLLGPRYLEAEKDSWTNYESKFLETIDKYKPNIIHVFGSEMHFGLIGGKTEVPVIIHIQGILNPYFNAYLPPFYSWNSIGRIKSFINKRLWEQWCFREKEILARVKNYIGRTTWDERITSIYNPSANYFYGGEILRRPFYESCTRVLPERLSIVSTISDPYYKGFDLILKTACILKKQLHLDFTWIVFGNIKPKITERIVNISYRENNIVLKGVATADELKSAICNSTVFVHPSYIDNSPNSVCEAQLLGSTVLAANVGGLPSLIEDGETGFLFPANDSYQLAFLIKKVYSSQALNNRIGQNSRDMALKRHNQDRIVSDLLNVYKKIIENTNT